MAAIQLKEWMQGEYMLGSAERGEKCRGCKRYMQTEEQCITLRHRHLEKPWLIGPIIEQWCMTCADLLDGTPMQIAIGPKGGRIQKLDELAGDMGEYIKEFWRGVRVEKVGRIEYKRKWY